MIGRDVFDIILQFFFCSLFFFLSHTSSPYEDHCAGFVSVWGERVEKITSELCFLFFAVLLLVRPDIAPVLSSELYLIV